MTEFIRRSFLPATNLQIRAQVPTPLLSAMRTSPRRQCLSQVQLEAIPIPFVKRCLMRGQSRGAGPFLPFFPRFIGPNLHHAPHVQLRFPPQEICRSKAGNAKPRRVETSSTTRFRSNGYSPRTNCRYPRRRMSSLCPGKVACSVSASSLSPICLPPSWWQRWDRVT